MFRGELSKFGLSGEQVDLCEKFYRLVMGRFLQAIRRS